MPRNAAQPQSLAIETTATVTVRVPKTYWPKVMRCLHAQLPEPERFKAYADMMVLERFDGPAAIAWLETHRGLGAAGWLSQHLLHVPAAVRPHLTEWIFESR